MLVRAERLELLLEVVPRLSRLAVLRDPPAGTVELALQETQAAAQTLGLQLQILEVRRPKDFDSAFLEMVKKRSGALLVISTPMLFSGRMRIAELAAKHRLPAVYTGRNTSRLVAFCPTGLISLKASAAPPFMWIKF